MLFNRVKRFTGGIMKHKRKTPRNKKTGERLTLLCMYSMLFLSALAISFVMCAQNSKLYLYHQEKCGLFEGAFPEDRRAVIRMNESVTDFLSGETKTIENASERANLHMKDVKRIFDRTENAALCFFVFSMLLALWKRDVSGVISLVPVFFTSFLFALLTLSDFSGLFYAFHERVFDNDLWLLSPEEDLLIRCLPEDFFYRMALSALACGLLIYLFFCLILFLINKFGRRD